MLPYSITFFIVVVALSRNDKYINLLRVKIDVVSVITSIFACVLSQSCLTLCDTMDGSWSGSSVHNIFQARILEWVAISYSRDLLHPGIKPVSLSSPLMTGGFFITVPPRKPLCCL